MGLIATTIMYMDGDELKTDQPCSVNPEAVAFVRPFTAEVVTDKDVLTVSLMVQSGQIGNGPMSFLVNETLDSFKDKYDANIAVEEEPGIEPGIATA